MDHSFVNEVVDCAFLEPGLLEDPAGVLPVARGERKLRPPGLHGGRREPNLPAIRQSGAVQVLPDTRHVPRDGHGVHGRHDESRPTEQGQKLFGSVSTDHCGKLRVDGDINKAIEFGSLLPKVVA